MKKKIESLDKCIEKKLEESLHIKYGLGKMPRIGQAVKVFSADGKTFLGTGKYAGCKNGIPKLKVGKKTYFGYECWWITASEANKVEKKLNINIKVK